MDTPLADPNLDTEERTTFRGFIDDEEVGTGTLVLRADDARTFTQEIAGEAFGRLAGDATVTFRRRGGELHAETQSILLNHKGKQS
ncbi:MAG: hypothetical protein Q7T55_05120, partial [Solirubrobacteraceae bacterium]|nr:hypothetical protein [Solirubrobacteraceae bacterium]